MERSLYNQRGSVDDTRCTLRFINPSNLHDARNEYDLLTASIKNERINQNRSSMIKMLESKMSRIIRLIRSHIIKRIDMKLKLQGGINKHTIK